MGLVVLVCATILNQKSIKYLSILYFILTIGVKLYNQYYVLILILRYTFNYYFHSNLKLKNLRPYLYIEEQQLLRYVFTYTF